MESLGREKAYLEFELNQLKADLGRPSEAPERPMKSTSPNEDTSKLKEEL